MSERFNRNDANVTLPHEIATRFRGDPERWYR
jgi:hypothetical protein